MVKERDYYITFKKLKDDSLLTYFRHLNTHDWCEFFDDYFNGEFEYLSRILIIPKGETIHSYGLLLIEDVDPETKNSITKGISNLLNSYYTRNKFDHLKFLFNTIRYLELNIDSGILIEIIRNNKIDKNIREDAAIALSLDYQSSLAYFWDSLDLTSESFLVPSYIGYFKKLNPIKGILKLKSISIKPESTFAFIAPVKASLWQISNSQSHLKEYAQIKDALPTWAKEFINKLTTDYIELNDLPNRLKYLKGNNYFLIIKKLSHSWIFYISVISAVIYFISIEFFGLDKTIYQNNRIDTLKVDSNIFAQFNLPDRPTFTITTTRDTLIQKSDTNTNITQSLDSSKITGFKVVDALKLSNSKVKINYTRDLTKKNHHKIVSKDELIYYEQTLVKLEQILAVLRAQTGKKKLLFQEDYEKINEIYNYSVAHRTPPDSSKLVVIEIIARSLDSE